MSSRPSILDPVLAREDETQMRGPFFSRKGMVGKPTDANLGVQHRAFPPLQGPAHQLPPLWTHRRAATASEEEDMGTGGHIYF